MENIEKVKRYIKYSNRKLAEERKSKKMYHNIMAVSMMIMMMFIPYMTWVKYMVDGGETLAGKLVNVWALVGITIILTITYYYEKVERKKVEAKIEKGFTEEELGQFNDLDIMDDSSKMYILNDMYTGQGYVLKVRGYLIYEGMEEYEESKVIIE